jgi:putative peptidoglycan lipid II flippase
MDHREGIAKSTTVVSAATFVSRLFGLMREQVFAHFFGATLATDAFVAAFRIPNLLRDLFAEGALSAAFVPVFTDTLVNKGKKDAFRLANLLLNGLVLVLSGVVFVGIFITPSIVHLIAPGFGNIPGKAELTAVLARIMFPFLPLISMAAVSMGMLNSLKRFGVPAFAPVLLNLGMILSGFLICPLFKEPIVGMAIGVLLGGLGQWAFQIPTLRKEGYRYQPVLSFRDPGVRRILLLMTPAVLGLASTQINIFVNTMIASSIKGAVSWLNYSFRLMHFPLGMFGVAVATVTLPALSGFAARKDIANVLSTCNSSLKLVLFLTIPSTFFLAVAARPIISVLYQHGVFKYADTVNTGQALLFYAIGLFAYSSVRVLAQVFYSLGDTRTPVKTSMLAVAVNITLNLLVVRSLGFRGLALATSISAFVNLAGLALSLNRRVGRLDLAGLSQHIGRVLACSLLMAAAVFAAMRLVPVNLKTAGISLRIMSLSILTAVAGGSYLFFSALFKIKELPLLLKILKRAR